MYSTLLGSVIGPRVAWVSVSNQDRKQAHSLWLESLWLFPLHKKKRKQAPQLLWPHQPAIAGNSQAEKAKAD